MADRMHTREVLTVLILCILWYIVSSSNNVVGKMLLNDFPYPMTVTMVQLLSITIYSGPFFNMWGVRRFVDISWSYYWKLIVPLALGKFMASIFTHVSIWKVPVSYAHTVKATMPLFTVVLSRFILGEKQTCKVYASLVPIITGVAVATMTELSFDLTGLLSALAATLQYSLQNIFSKKVLHDTGVHHLRLLHILGRLALIMFLPIWFYFDFGSVMKECASSLPPYILGRLALIMFLPIWFYFGFGSVMKESVFNTDDSYRIIALLFLDGVLSWLQNILAFSVMSLVSSLTYAVASASKRIFVISASLLILGNPVTGTNIFGMTLAILGVLCYNKAKYDARQMEKRKTILPFTSKTWKSNGVPYNALPSYEALLAQEKPPPNGHTPPFINNGKPVQFV